MALDDVTPAQALPKKHKRFLKSLISLWTVNFTIQAIATCYSFPAAAKTSPSRAPSLRTLGNPILSSSVFHSISKVTGLKLVWNFIFCNQRFMLLMFRQSYESEVINLEFRRRHMLAKTLPQFCNVCILLVMNSREDSYTRCSFTAQYCTVHSTCLLLNVDSI